MKQLPSNNSDFILYTSPEREVRVDIFVNKEAVWLTQKAIANLFDMDRIVITKHLKNIFTPTNYFYNQKIIYYG